MTTTRSLMVVVTVLTAIALCALPAQAQTIYEGQIMSVSPTRMIVLHEVGGLDWTFAVVPEAIIHRNGAPVRLEDLRVGDSATLIARDRAAIMIDVHSRL